MTLAVRGGVVAGRIVAGGRVWVVESRAPGVHAIHPVTQPLHCSTDVHAALEQPGPHAAASVATSEDDGSTIDVLVLFTTAVRQRQGYERTHAEIDLAVAATNEAYRAFGAVQRLNLVAAVETGYERSTEHVGPVLDARVDWRRLQTAGDGYLEDAHRLRDQYAADIVYLTYTGQSGAGGLLLPLIPRDQSSEGFAMGRTHPDFSYTFARELGHVMGLLHERFEGTSNAIHPYAYGYVNQLGLYEHEPDTRRWETIMAYGVQCWTLGSL